MPKRVSIVICAYNVENDLKDCLESLEKQDYQETELIVVDDASEDATLNYLRDFKENTKIKTVFTSNQSNLGVAGSRNAGIRLASGDIIAFTDADCVADRRWISELVRGFCEMNAHAVGGGVMNGPAKNIWELLDKGNNFVAPEEGFVPYIQGCNMSFSAPVLRKYMFNDEIKYGFEETILCDYLMKDGCKIYYRPQAIVHHKSRNTFISLGKLKYRRGQSSVWYRKKQNKLFIYLRHIILFLALLCIPLSIFNGFFGYLALSFFFVFCLGLFRDEIILRTKKNRQIFVTFPFLVLIEFAHFWGSLVGFWKFRVLKKDEKK